MLFAVIPTRVLRDPTLSVTAKAVLAAVASHADPEGLAWPARSRIAGYLGLDVRTVARAFRDLRRAGALEVIPRTDPGTGAQRSSLLRVLFDRPEGEARALAAAVPGEDPEAPPHDTGVTPPGDTHVLPPGTPMSYRTRSLEQSSTSTAAAADLEALFTDEAHRIAFRTLRDRAPHTLTFEAELRALLTGMRGAVFTPAQLGAAMVDLLSAGASVTGFTLRRFAQKARATESLPDPEVRSYPRDVGAASIEALEAAVRAEREGRAAG